MAAAGTTEAPADAEAKAVAVAECEGKPEEAEAPATQTVTEPGSSPKVDTLAVDVAIDTALTLLDE
jgi:hypothetical protein